MGSQTFIPRDYDVFAGLDVDKKRISVTFTDHQGLADAESQERLRQLVRLTGRDPALSGVAVLRNFPRPERA